MVTAQLILNLEEIFTRPFLPIAGSGAILRYDIAGWVNIGDPFIWFGSTVATDPRITITEPVFIDRPSTTFPGLNTCTMRFFGPNFASSLVPGQSSDVLLSGGLLSSCAGVPRAR